MSGEGSVSGSFSGVCGVVGVSGSTGVVGVSGSTGVVGVSGTGIVSG